MADLGAIFGSALGGGLFGVIGQLGNRAFGIWEAREKRKDMVLAYAQEEKRWAHENSLLELQMKARAEETEQELSLADMRGGWDAFTASQQAEHHIGKSWPWVEAVRALTRPVLTLEAQLLLALVFFLLPEAMQDDLLPGIVETITFAASASLLWWFGERARRPGAGKG